MEIKSAISIPHLRPTVAVLGTNPEVISEGYSRLIHMVELGKLERR
jgi:hypothetical protein